MTKGLLITCLILSADLILGSIGYGVYLIVEALS